MPHAKFDELNKEAQLFSETAEKYYREGDCAKALAWHRKALGNFELALGHLTKQLPLFEEKLGVDHDTTAKTRDNIAQMQNIVASTNSNIGEAHRCQKQYAQALKWFQQALAIQENTKDANTATTYNNIALVYDDQRNYTRALEWLQKDLTISEAAQNLGTATTYNNIGMVHFHQGDIDGALEWYRKALAIQEKSLGPDAPGQALLVADLKEFLTKPERLTLSAKPKRPMPLSVLAGGADWRGILNSLDATVAVNRRTPLLVKTRAAAV
jgi:tetratricopeptide (TPR) repeat protein